MGPPFFEGQVIECAFPRDETPDHGPDDLVRFAKRHALGDQVIRDIGREQQPRRGSLSHGRVE